MTPVNSGLEQGAAAMLALEALVALDPPVSRIAEFAFLVAQLDTVDAALALISFR